MVSQVGVLSLLKVYNLFRWHDTWVEQDTSTKLAHLWARCNGRKPPPPKRVTMRGDASSSAAASTSTAAMTAAVAREAAAATAPPSGRPSNPHAGPSAADFGYSHQGPDGAWTPYTAGEAAAITTAIKQRPEGGSLQLGAGPFAVHWGSEARTPHRATPPSGMLQVNRRTGMTRAVRRDDLIRVSIQS